MNAADQAKLGRRLLSSGSEAGTSDTVSVKAEVTWDGSAQHTLSWAEDLSLRGEPNSVALPAGSCNLYLFPAIDGAGPASDRGLHVLQQLILAVAQDTSMGSLNYFDIPDEVGAFPIHAITVANTVSPDA